MRAPKTLPADFGKAQISLPPSEKRQPRQLPPLSADRPIVRTSTNIDQANTQPRAMQGQVRTGLMVQAGQLFQHFPSIDPDVVELCLQQLRGVGLDTFNLQQALAWGHELQQSYSGLVEQSLQLSQSPERIAASGHLQRLHELLQEIALALEQQLNPTLLSRWRSSAQELLAQHHAEMTHLRSNLLPMAQTLHSQAQQAGQLHQRFHTLAQALQAASLSATYLAEQLLTQSSRQYAAGCSEVVQALHQRASALAQACTTVQQTQLLRQRSEADVRSLCASIEHAVLLLLPAWLEKTMFSTQAAAPIWTPTQTRSLQHELSQLLSQLTIA